MNLSAPDDVYDDKPHMKSSDRIYVAGHRGLVGSAIHRALLGSGYSNIVTRTHAELDLRDGPATEAFFAAERPDYVFFAAAKVGGILANSTYPADFLLENLLIQASLFEASRKNSVKRLLFLGSSCIYPKLARQPMPESCLLTASLEPTNRPYALAKIVGVEMCWSYNRQFGTRFVAAMPTNLYGPGDNFDLANSHVLPALIRKAMEAKNANADEMVVWGTGVPRRELMHSNDLADACLFIMNLAEPKFGTLIHEEEPPLLNIGVGEDVTIRELAEMVARIVGFTGRLIFDASKPDGTPRKLMNVDRMTRLGWRAKVGLEDGIRQVCAELSTPPDNPKGKL